MNDYFISYWWHVGLRQGYGDMHAALEAPIRTAEHIADLRGRIAQEGPIPSDATVIICNIVRLS